MIDKNINVSQLRKFLKNKPKSFYLIDVRTPEEYSHGHIDTSINIPIDQISNALKMEPKKFEEMYHVDKPKKCSTIVFNCGIGIRSGQALEIARENGYEESCHLERGYSSWVADELHNKLD